MQSIKTWRFIILYILLGIAALYVHTRSEASVPVNRPLAEFAQEAGPWRMIGEARFDERVLTVLLPTDYLSRTYQDDKGNQVSLYLGYHDGGPNSGPIHSPKQCLPGSGWNRLSDKTGQIDVGGQSVAYVSAEYQKDIEKQLFLYWFQVRDQYLTDEYALKFAMARNSFLHNRRDSSFIRISVMMGDSMADAEEIGRNFMQNFVPHINQVLPR